MKLTVICFEGVKVLGDQASKFILVGALTATLDLSILYVLTRYVGVNYLVSAALGFIAGSSCNYILSIRWVFTPGKYGQRLEFTFFIMTSLIGLMINQFVMWLSVAVLVVHYLVAKGVAIATVAAWNFIAKKKLVFLN